MRIDSSVMRMESSRSYTAVSARASRFQVKSGNGQEAHKSNGFFGSLSNNGGSGYWSENSWQNMQGNAQDDAQSTTATVDSIRDLRDRVESMRGNRIQVRSSTQEVFHRFRQQAIRSIFAMLFGVEKTKGVFGDDYLEGLSSQTEAISLGGGTGNTLVLSNEQYYEESESTSFVTKGLVKTADGREISIDLEVGMSRRFTSYFKDELQIAQINTCDPLVLNFGGGAAELTDQKFFFDIDADGELDEISMLGSNSGYLALDKNGDGKINDGSELFGPESGNGFGDLAAYDEDGNGWIDENDPIWSKLKIWCKNADGTDSLYTLSEKGVGAICLRNVSTDFSLNDAQNRTGGIIRNTGVFLYETGEVGTVQHLDLAR